MKIHRGIDQQSAEWFRIRAGCLTSSGVSKILTAKRLEPSSQADAYLAKLGAERILGMPCGSFAGNASTERGHEMEPEARDQLAWELGVDIEQVAFISNDEETMGFSPDGIIAESAGVEIKCHEAPAHFRWLMDKDAFIAEHRLQVQFDLWLSEWTVYYQYGFCMDAGSGHGLPPILLEIKPDAKVHAAFDKHVPPFLARVEEAVAMVEAMRESDDDNPFI